MGLTLRAALDILRQPPSSPGRRARSRLLEWNRRPLELLARRPLDDLRVRVEEGDVAATMLSNPGRFDAVLSDVDNGPLA